MAFTISYVTSAAAFSFTKETAEEALEMAMDYLAEGYRAVRLEDTAAGVTYGEHGIRRAWKNGKVLDKPATGPKRDKRAL
jgi:cellobiose phosphorylase